MSEVSEHARQRLAERVDLRLLSERGLLDMLWRKGRPATPEDHRVFCSPAREGYEYRIAFWYRRTYLIVRGNCERYVTIIRL